MTRRVVGKQSTCGRVWGSGGYLIGNHYTAAVVSLEAGGKTVFIMFCSSVLNCILSAGASYVNNIELWHPRTTINALGARDDCPVGESSTCFFPAMQGCEIQRICMQ